MKKNTAKYLSFIFCFLFVITCVLSGSFSSIEMPSSVFDPVIDYSMDNGFERVNGEFGAIFSYNKHTSRYTPYLEATSAANNKDKNNDCQSFIRFLNKEDEYPVILKNGLKKTGFHVISEINVDYLTFSFVGEKTPLYSTDHILIPFSFAQSLVDEGFASGIGDLVGKTLQGFSEGEKNYFVSGIIEENGFYKKYQNLCGGQFVVFPFGAKLDFDSLFCFECVANRKTKVRNTLDGFYNSFFFEKNNSGDFSNKNNRNFRFFDNDFNDTLGLTNTRVKSTLSFFSQPLSTVLFFGFLAISFLCEAGSFYLIFSSRLRLKLTCIFYFLSLSLLLLLFSFIPSIAISNVILLTSNAMGAVDSLAVFSLLLVAFSLLNSNTSRSGFFKGVETRSVNF